MGSHFPPAMHLPLACDMYPIRPAVNWPNVPLSKPIILNEIRRQFGEIGLHVINLENFTAN